MFKNIIFTRVSQCLRVYLVSRQGICLMESLRDLCAFLSTSYLGTYEFPNPVEKDMPTLPEHLSSSPDFSGVRVMRSLVLYVCFVDRCLPFCTFSFGHCIVCSGDELRCSGRVGMSFSTSGTRRVNL
jgi:hypothetical protein